MSISSSRHQRSSRVSYSNCMSHCIHSFLSKKKKHCIHSEKIGPKNCSCYLYYFSRYMIVSESSCIQCILPSQKYWGKAQGIKENVFLILQYCKVTRSNSNIRQNCTSAYIFILLNPLMQNVQLWCFLFKWIPNTVLMDKREVEIISCSRTTQISQLVCTCCAHAMTQTKATKFNLITSLRQYSMYTD